MNTKIKMALAAGLAAGVAGLASAGPVITFTYTNLAGRYIYDLNTDTGNFHANATATQQLQTDGSVSLAST